MSTQIKSSCRRNKQWGKRHLATGVKVTSGRRMVKCAEGNRRTFLPSPPPTPPSNFLLYLPLRLNVLDNVNRNQHKRSRVLPLSYNRRFVLPFFGTSTFDRTFSIFRTTSRNKVSIRKRLKCYTHSHEKGHAVAQLVEALPFKPEGRGFDSRWFH